MFYEDDVGGASTPPRELTRMMDVIAVACQEFGLTVSDKKTQVMHLCDLTPARHRTRIELRRQGNGITIQPSLCTLVVRSVRARTSTLI